MKRNNLPHGECTYMMIWFRIKRNLLIHLRRSGYFVKTHHS
ncbi:hypothetical protein HanPSC8_Chr02g0072341 [Helianthus annuus]|nr:hypothetical protein HanPSC8_Chr02g0072341 [Helianthus annuus]